MPSLARRFKRRVFSLLLGPVPLGLKVRLARKLFPNLARYLPASRQVVIPDYLGRFRVSLDTTYPIEVMMLVDRYELESLYVINALVEPGHVCLDVGANVGALTLAMARQAGPGGRVYAFEPGPVTFERLRRNIALNPWLTDVVVPLSLGVADKPGTLFWNEDWHNRGNATLLESAGTAVEVVSLDWYFGQVSLPRLDFVKIDVEGMEYEVLTGARLLLATHKPILYFETLSHFDAIRGFPTLDRIEAFLRDLDYELYRVHRAGRDYRLAPATAAAHGANTLAIPASRREVLRALPRRAHR